MNVGKAILLSWLTLTVPVFAEAEPNGSRAQANTITVNISGVATTSGWVTSTSDLDYFAISDTFPCVP